MKIIPVADFNVEDLTTLEREMADLSRVTYVGVGG